MWNFVLGDQGRRRVDFHVIFLTPDGTGILGLSELGQTIPAEALNWTGTLDGREVRCISPRSLVAFHTGYPVDENDWADVKALCETFDLAVPEDYRPFLDR